MSYAIRTCDYTNMRAQTLIAFTLASSFVFAGCSSLSNVDYHNSVSQDVLALSEAVDVTLDAYDAAVPVSIDAETLVDVTEMQSAYEAASLELDQMNQTLQLESFDQKQEEAIRSSLNVYVSKTTDYLNEYKEMITFYSSDFSEDLDRVITFDDAIFVHYNAHVDAHNDLADALGQY